MPAKIDPFHAIEISTLAFRLAEQGRSVIHMEFGQPAAGAPQAALDAARETLDAGVPGYWESGSLKRRLAARYEKLYGIHVEPEQILLTCGASPALVLALVTAFSPGDRVAVARPGYVAYRNTLRGLHMDAVEIGCGADTRFQLSAAHLEALDEAPAGVIISSPANPTGSIIPPEELARIAQVCAARGIRIVSDEIYHGLVYHGTAQTMLAYAPDSLVVNSFSKYFCMPGWRLGWLVSPMRDLDQASAYIGNFFLSAPSLSQKAALGAMDAGAELDRHIETYARNRDLMMDALPRLGLTEIAPPDGAFYIYANVERFTDDSLVFCRQMLNETGVATASGRDFDPVDGHRYMRFSFAVSTAQAEEALARIGPWFAAQRG